MKQEIRCFILCPSRHFGLPSCDIHKPEASQTLHGWPSSTPSRTKNCSQVLFGPQLNGHKVEVFFKHNTSRVDKGEPGEFWNFQQKEIQNTKCYIKRGHLKSSWHWNNALGSTEDWSLTRNKIEIKCVIFRLASCNSWDVTGVSNGPRCYLQCALMKQMMG